MMQCYFAMGNLKHESQDKAFWGIVSTKPGERLRKSGGLSDSRLRQLLLNTVAHLGMDPAFFGMHSLRAGGTTAAANTGVPDRLFINAWAVEIRVCHGWVCVESAVGCKSQHMNCLLEYVS